MKIEKTILNFRYKKAAMVWIAVCLAAALLLGCWFLFRPLSGSKQIINSMLTEYAGENHDPEKIQNLLRQLRTLDPEAGAKWEKIMDFWDYANTRMPIQYDSLPEDLEISGTLCIAVLGYQLSPDGTMRSELIDRLQVALRCAEQYPDSFILCTGGGTASQNPSATEAGAMSAWLMEQGVSPDRLIVEDRSKTTAQNAQFSHRLLAEQHPEIGSIVIVSSDYHIPWAAALFETEALLLGEGHPHVIGHAAMPTGVTNNYMNYQLLHMRELAGIR